MSITPTHDSKAATKVITKACNVVDRRNIANGAPASEKARQFGRYEKSIDELAETVEKYRQVGAQP